LPEHRQGRLAGSDCAERFTEDALRNPHNRAILDGLPALALALPDAWLVAGCLFQTVWNLRCERVPDAGIRDYDLFYFDSSDLSAGAEQAVEARVRRHFASLPVTIEAKNQARVHTWYADWFGAPYAASLCSRDGIDRFLVDCTCVGMQPSDSGPLLYALPACRTFTRARCGPTRDSMPPCCTRKGSGLQGPMAMSDGAFGLCGKSLKSCTWVPVQTGARPLLHS
jgi:hypothetical protein